MMVNQLFGGRDDHTSYNGNDTILEDLDMIQ